jgi:AraC-like DNA-binding protein
VQYTEHAPSPALASLVHCVWTLEGDAAELGADAQPILPDGRPELVLHFGDPFDRVGDDGVERQPSVMFAGQLKGPLTLRPTGRIAVLGLRFHPDGASLLLDAPQRELAGLTVDVGAVSKALARTLAEVRDRRTSLDDARAGVQECLRAYADPPALDRQVRQAVLDIDRRHGRVTIEDLAARAGTTRRQLERRFERVVGLSPKRLARIARFQHALRTLTRLDSPQRGTETAAMCGYADQAHFIRDFREFAGCAPGAHLLRQAELTGFFTGR